MGQATHESIKNRTDQGLDAVEEKVLSGLDTTRKITENAAEHAAEIQQKTQDTVSDLTKTVATYVQEKPLQAAGIAFAAGIVTTLLLSRRS